MTSQGTDCLSSNDSSTAFGKHLANPPPGEEVVISGLAGKFPDSDNVYELRDNLFDKKDLVSDDDRRWKTNNPDIPQRAGKLRDIDRFDAGSFGIHHRQATSMDPMIRLLLERVMECIFDAGIHPSELEGTNTGVFVGVCFNEIQKTWFFDELRSQMFAITGCERSMLSRRVSYFLKLNGPSFVFDSACSSSLYALEHAYESLRLGECDRAIVASTNICLHPFLSYQFRRLGATSKEGICKTFDAERSGYVRSECVAAIFVQRAKEARRMYSTVVHVKTNSDGYKDTGITYPSGLEQTTLLNQFYNECEVNVNDLTFFEAHATGTKVGDPEECRAIQDVLVKQRNKPLLIGSIKSNIGHTEPVSGLTSIAKAIIAMETGYIPPNIHFKTPLKEIKAFEEGSLIVVTEKTKLPDNNGLIGINGFGFGGSNCHVLLKWNPRSKDCKNQVSDQLPRLVCVSGRTEEAVNVLLTDVLKNKGDIEHIGLLHEVFKNHVQGHIYRGFSIVTHHSKEIFRSVTSVKEKALVYVALSELTNFDLGCLVTNPVFIDICGAIQSTLASKNINIREVLSKREISPSDKILVTVVAQLCVVEVLKALGIEVAEVVGISFSDLVSAYWHGRMNLSEVVECVYVVAKASNEAVECSWLYVNAQKEVLHRLPDDVEVVFEISENAAIISGTTEAIFCYQKVLEENGIVHYLIGSVLNFKQGNCYRSKFCGSLSNLSLSTVKTLPRGAVVIEIGNGIFKNVLKVLRQEVRCCTINNFNSLLFNLGRLYEFGHNPQLYRLYPKVKFPVSRGTPMISPKIKWNHRRKWWVSVFNVTEERKIGERTVSITLKDSNYSFVGGHIIDERNLFPATAYLQLVWETLAQMKGLSLLATRIVFENCRFKRACSVPKEGAKLELTVMVQRGSGNFEIVEGNVVVVTGRVYEVQSKEKNTLMLPLPVEIPEHVAKPMLQTDIYKELRLRGYDYKDEFRAITRCDSSCQVGKVKWDGNWVTFMDNMLQMRLLQEDTRLLCVLTRIKRISIDPEKHILYVNNFGKNPDVPVYCYKDIDMIRSGGIEISGLVTNSIQRRKCSGTPVLEKYQFIPNVFKMLKDHSIRVQMQIVLENAYSVEIKIIELIDEAVEEDSLLLAPSIHDVLKDQPSVQPDILVLSKKHQNIPNIKINDRKLMTEFDCTLIVGSKFLERPFVLNMTWSSLKEGGFILSRESLNPKDAGIEDIEIVTVHDVGDEKLILFRKKSQTKPCRLIKVSVTDVKFEWLSKLQHALKDNSDVIVYSQNEPLNGVLGLVNCIRKEPAGQNCRCVFIIDEAPEFNPEHPFYVEQLRKNIAINIYKNGHWGTYRHLLLENVEDVEVEHCYVNLLSRGDLSSLTWVEGPLTHNSRLTPEYQLIYVYYSTLNVHDVMIATGKLNVDIVTKDRRGQECVLGCEFSGRTIKGKRVMGIARNGAISTLISSDSSLLWEVPDSWTLEDAATVPVAYTTSLCALLQKGRIRRGHAVLIHSGTGDIGQSSIALALFFGCRVYTTVGTPEKREFVKKIFPQLTDRNIASSRDTSFERHIMRETNGRGVDIVLNSLEGEKLLASVRCLGRGGRFVQIGKYDLGQDNAVSLLLLQKDASFHGLTLDMLFDELASFQMEAKRLLDDALDQGAVKPLQRNVFKKDEIEAAFRYMMTETPVGKVLVQVRKEELDKTFVPTPDIFKATPRYCCDETKTYIIIGGLGGFGLELADWLILRGAKNLVLTSRSGVNTGYQEYRIGIWRSYGCTVQISTEDVTKKEGCHNLIVDANKLGPVHAIFNLAVILSDSFLENQCEESYKTAFAPKVYATEYLDEVTRALCPELRDFVVFSSVTCGRGHAGQTNYCMANSMMERICEKRRAEGYPALAIEWGAVEDAGLAAEIQDHKMGGMQPQRIDSCLGVLDTFLKQRSSSIVSSMVVAEKQTGLGGTDNVIEAVANILGVRDLKAVSMHFTLAEMGMDSFNTVEVKQILERELKILLTTQDIKNMTFAKLQHLVAEKDKGNNKALKKEKALVGLDVVVRLLGDEETANIPVVTLQGKEGSTNKSNVFLFPGIEGVASFLDPLARNLEGNLFGMQYCNCDQTETIEEMASAILPHLEQHLSKSQLFTIVAHSFGCVVGLEALRLLEERGYYGTYVCIDGAPALAKKFVNFFDVQSEDKFQTALVIHIMSLNTSRDIIDKHTEELFKCKSLEERIKLVQAVAGRSPKHSPEYQRDCVISFYKRLKAILAYQPSFRIKSKVKLIKPRVASIKMESKDYDLSELCDDVEVTVFDGDHVTILENIDVAQVINENLR